MISMVVSSSASKEAAKEAAKVAYNLVSKWVLNMPEDYKNKFVPFTIIISYENLTPNKKQRYGDKYDDLLENI
jgi:hypothetical protein